MKPRSGNLNYNNRHSDNGSWSFWPSRESICINKSNATCNGAWTTMPDACKSSRGMRTLNRNEQNISSVQG